MIKGEIKRGPPPPLLDTNLILGMLISENELHELMVSTLDMKPYFLQLQESLIPWKVSTTQTWYRVSDIILRAR